ncbi:hypothetical protein GOBAR_AA21893 [Gossypium barbadense]|uniref:Uncharacterized protein n=1 Tax=Gossypium barbadense TaxID=3634 RepID=A0A2P5X612_GOSBA|nr:hypothetical protein GOBAR_AA21893 [Gossypium barbadense]
MVVKASSELAFRLALGIVQKSISLELGKPLFTGSGIDFNSDLAVRSWLKPCPYLTPKTGYAAKKRKSLSLGSTFDFSFRESSESRTRALRKSRRSWQVDSHSLGYETLLPISKRNGLTRASSKLTIL